MPPKATQKAQAKEKGKADPAPGGPSPAPTKPAAPGAEGAAPTAAAAAAAAAAADPPAATAAEGLAGFFTGLFGGADEAPVTEDPIAKELDEVALAATAAAKHAADAVLHSAAEGRARLSTFVSSISRSWGGGDGAAASSSGADFEALRGELGVPAGEALLESFRCKLRQRYVAENGLTPARTLLLPGTLCVFAGRAAFVLDAPAAAERDAGAPARPAPLVLPAAEVGAAVALPARAGEPAALEVVWNRPGAKKGGVPLAFVAFKLGELEIDSALALFEHLKESAANPAAT